MGKVPSIQPVRRRHKSANRKAGLLTRLHPDAFPTGKAVSGRDCREFTLPHSENKTHSSEDCSGFAPDSLFIIGECDAPMKPLRCKYTIFFRFIRFGRKIFRKFVGSCPNVHNGPFVSRSTKNYFKLRKFRINLLNFAENMH